MSRAALAVGRYLRAHWRGEQPLAQAFWINLVLVRVAIHGGQAALRPGPGADYADWAWLVAPLAFFFHGVVFLWQSVGALRAAERRVRGFGGTEHLWGALLGAFAAFAFVCMDLWGAWLMTQPAPPPEDFFERQIAERAKRYRLEVSSDGRTLYWIGDMPLGATKAFDAALAAHGAVARVVFTSGGGNIFEARGVARRLRERSLAAHVEGECLSACAVAFIGGVRRTLGPGAALGFHQYRIDADYRVPFADPAAEQDRDRALFREAGVAEWFLIAMFRAEPGAMWRPDEDTLRRAGVLTR